MPASVKKKYKQLSIKIIKALNIPNVSLVPYVETDPKPYVNFNIMGTDLRTTTQILGKHIETVSDESEEENKESKDEVKDEKKPKAAPVKNEDEKNKKNDEK